MRPLKAAIASVLVAASFVASGFFTSSAPAAPAAAPKRIQLVAHDEAVRDVLLRLGDLGHLSITVADDVTGKVNLSLHGVTPDEALHAVCVQAHLRCVRDGRTVSVSNESSVVVPLAIVPAARAGNVVRSMYPRLSVRVDSASNSLVLAGTAGDIAGARTIIQGLDVRDASKPTTEAVQLHSQPASAVAERLRALYPAAKITVVSRTTMLVSAAPADLTQIKSLVAGIDAATPVPSSAPLSSEAVKVLQRRPQDVARAVAAQLPHVHAAVSGSAVTVSGSPDDVARAKALIAQLDLPAYGSRYVQIYRIKNVDASSVADLIRRSFPDAAVTLDASLNALSVVATAGDHMRIADGIARIDGTATGASSGGDPAGVAPGAVPSSHEVIQLQSIIPNQGYGNGTTAQDIAQAVQQALQASAPDLRVVVPNGTTQVILTGSPQSVRAAKELLAELDAIPQSVVLDTEILELDESSSRNLGLQLGTTSIGTTFSEVQPTPNPNTGQPGRLIAFQPLTRTGISFQAQLNLLISNGRARVLADPRITALSGRTATIRAGDSISILTTVGGGSGTVATTQLQTFQTGVTLDITPIITNGGDVNVALHPVVNSLSGFLNGVPQISTRDTQTSVHLRDNETLVIGGLIEESSQHSESKLPLLGDIPIIGRVFRNQTTTSTRNELIIVVTPHILRGNETTTVPSAAGPPGMAVPTARPLPTLPPGTMFPAAPRTPTPTPTASPRAAAAKPTGKSGDDASASASPVASASPSPGASPVATPSAFAQANTFVYGSPPPSTYAGPSDAPVIFYAMLQPTIFTPNTNVRVSVITTTNVQRLTIGTSATRIGLSPLGQGKWQGVFAANALSLPPSAATVQLTLSAARNDGQSASIQIPVSRGTPEPIL
ncbi:MAG TPA: secretin N-terminal domain-containing protein [Candidatus Limnocylindrales bacterium]|nr:secretin N-terminal domain-containing protein [Candidatus Limnocylindrales bacterium]